MLPKSVLALSVLMTGIAVFPFANSQTGLRAKSMNVNPTEGFSMQTPPDPAKGKAYQSPLSEVLGATSRPFQLTEKSTTVRLDLHEPSGPLRQHAGALKYKLLVEGYKASIVIPSYRIYVNLPSGTASDQMGPYFANLLPVFGLVEASMASGGHAGGGLTLVTDITSLSKHLATLGRWDAKHVAVTFIPENSSVPFTVDVTRVSVVAE